jgi:drug/metabolite transporter (DMT)-like permease
VSRDGETREAAHGAQVAAPSAAFVAVCLVAVYLIWGSTYLAIRIAVTALPPFLLAGLRHLTAATFLYGWARWRGLRAGSTHEIRNAALIGVLLVAGGNGLVTWAEQWVSSSLTAAIVASGSIWIVVILAALGERVSRGEKVGILIGFAGVVLLNLEGEVRANPLGALALFGATMCWSTGSVLSRRIALPVGAMATVVEMAAGGALMTVAGFASGERIVLSTLTAPAALAWLYLVTAGSLIGFSAFSFLIRNVRPALATSFAYVNPAVALVLGVALGGEHVTRTGSLGVMVSIVGVAVLTLSRRPTA